MSSTQEFLQIPSRVLRQASQFKPHIPSGIRRPAFLGQLAVFSHRKLQQEAASHTPDLRRCLGHHGIFQKCVKAAQENGEQRAAPAASLSQASCHEPSVSPLRAQIILAMKAMVRRIPQASRASKSTDLVHVHTRESRELNAGRPRDSRSTKIMLGLKSLSRREKPSDDKALGRNWRSCQHGP